MDINKLSDLKKKFPHARIEIKDGDKITSDFEIKPYYSSEGFWVLQIIPRFPN